MGKKFLVPPTLPVLDSPPSNPNVGDMYFDTYQGSVGVYTESGWKYVPWSGGGSGGSVTVFQTTIGNGRSSTYTITHNLGTTNINVSLIDLGSNEKVGAKVVVLNQNQISVSFARPIPTNSIKVVIIG